MKVESNISSYGREVTVRISRHEANVLSEHLCRDPGNEQIAYALAGRASTAEGTLFIINELFLPEASELAEQGPAHIAPKEEFVSYVYLRAHQTGQSVVEFHTHPGESVPHFSGVDDTHAHQNARYMAQKLPPSVAFMLIVGNNKFNAHDGAIYDPHLKHFRGIDRFEILGRPSEIRLIGEKPVDSDEGFAEEFSRQALIPQWSQRALERQRIAIVGLGGNGSPTFQTLVSIGAGSQGWLCVVDPDHLEESNLPRIPYATSAQLGIPKVCAAVQFAAQKRPGLRVYPYPSTVSEKTVQHRLKAATMVIGCIDRDGPREELNQFAVRCGIPYIDMACEIQTRTGKVEAGGQVRVVLPGQNACLVCCRGFDPSQAALDKMDDAGKAIRAAHGYVENSSELATSSVANLNGLASHFAVSAMLSLVHGEQFCTWDYLHFDQFSGRTIPANTSRADACPACGPEGYLCAGDPLPVKAASKLVKADEILLPVSA